MRNPRLDDSPRRQDSVARAQDQIQKPGTSASERLIRLRSIISAAQDAYEKELEQLDSLNSVKADPATEVPIVG